MKSFRFCVKKHLASGFFKSHVDRHYNCINNEVLLDGKIADPFKISGVSLNVFARGLKAKMAITIAMLLFVAMVLIDLVIVVTTQNEFIRAEVSKGDILLARLQDDLIATCLWENIGSHSASKVKIRNILNEAGVSCALIMGRDGGELCFGEKQCPAHKKLVGFTRQAILSGQKTINFSGKIWGIFWKQNRNIIISLPLFQNRTPVAGASIVLPLEGIYERLRRNQKIFLVYILINMAILGFVGIHRLSKVYFQPLTRLARRAEEYRDDDEFIFTVRKGDNELNTLSKALNSMLRRISDDKETLRSTVMSLEKANLELKKAQEEIIRAEKLASVGRLSAGIAHEIGNPIGIVMGYLELLKQTDISEAEKDEYILRTENEIERINTIIRQLLEISRPSSTELRAVAVHELIDDIADVLKVQPLMSNIDLKRQLSSENDTVLADPSQLRQVFLNLIINAADAISSTDRDVAGQLKITSELETVSETESQGHPSMLKIRFIDNGPGIPEEDIGNIFDPFFTTKEPGKGTGLGLSVSFMIVEGLGGKMSVNSEIGKGTTMIINLPLFEPEHSNCKVSGVLPQVDQVAEDGNQKPEDRNHKTEVRSNNQLRN
ncbi:MAG: ATP-binding protein [Desulfobacterales bacterium]|jgi:signal transduction histidine kinase